MLEYIARTDKGDVHKGDLFNGVFGLGESSEARTNYTSQVIIETVEGGSGSGELSVALTPMATKRFTGPDGVAYDAKIVHKDGTVEYVDVVDKTIPGLQDGDKVAYFSEEFQMEHVPAQDIPTIGPRMSRIPLVAEPRRIAVRYDQITA